MLPTAERPLRLAEFDELFATTVRSIEHASSTRARLLLAGEAGTAERAQRLADAETSCCSFFTFAVTALQDGQVALDIDVPSAYADVLGALVARAEGRMDGAS
jgi:hypothetical protein